MNLLARVDVTESFGYLYGESGDHGVLLVFGGCLEVNRLLDGIIDSFARLSILVLSSSIGRSGRGSTYW